MCCCCASLRTGSIIIAVLGIVFYGRKHKQNPVHLTIERKKTFCDAIHLHIVSICCGQLRNEELDRRRPLRSHDTAQRLSIPGGQGQQEGVHDLMAGLAREFHLTFYGEKKFAISITFSGHLPCVEPDRFRRHGGDLDHFPGRRRRRKNTRLKIFDILWHFHTSFF